VLSVFDCWNREKFKDIDARNNCSVEAEDVLKQIRACEQKPPKEISFCLSGITNQDMVVFYLNNKLRIQGMSPNCGEKDVDCLATAAFNLAPPGNTVVNTTTNDVNPASDSGLAAQNPKTGNNVVGNVATGAAVGTGLVIAQQVNRNSGVNAGSGGVNLNSSAGNNLNGVGNKSVGQSDLTGLTGNGWFTFFKDYKMMRDYRKSTNPYCRDLHSAAKTKVLGSVAATGLVVATTIVAANMIKKNNDKEEQDKDKSIFFKTAAMGTSALGAGVLIKTQTNKIAQRKIDTAIIGLTEQLRSTGVVDCGIQADSKTTKYLPIIKFNNKDLLMAKNQINLTSNPVEAIMVYSQWEAYLNGEYLHEFDYNELNINRENIPAEVFVEVKKLLVSMIEGSFDFFIPSAHADSADTKSSINLEQMLPMIMQLAPLLTEFKEKQTPAEKKADEQTANSDVLTRAHGASIETKQETGQLAKTSIEVQNREKVHTHMQNEYESNN
jgi:hypothetical protein